MLTCRLPRRFVLALLVVVVFAPLFTSPELLHAHRAGTVGLYNAECPLAEIAARYGVASLPSAPPIVAPWWTVGPAPAAAVAQILAPFARCTNSRAPPLA